MRRFWLLALCPALFGQTISAPPLQPNSAPVYSPNVQLSIFYTTGKQSVVLWNGIPLPTIVSASQLSATIPAANLQTLGYAEVAIYDPATGVTTPPAYFFTYVPIATNAIIYDAKRDLIYGSVPSIAPQYGNTIAAIRPETGDIVKNVFIGSEPSLMALSDDFQYLYVGLDGASAVRRLNLDSFQPDIQFPLDQGNTQNLITGYGLYVANLAVVPGSPDSVVIARRYSGLSPDYAGTAVYDKGVIRSKVTPTHTGPRQICFGGSASVLWGLNNNFGGMQQLTLDSSGLTITNGSNFSVDIGGFSGSILKFDAGRYYVNSGTVVDPAQRSVVGTFAASGPVQPDSGLGRVFFVSSGINSTSALQSFDLRTFVPLGSLPVPGSIGGGLLRWGSNGIAMQGGASYIFDTTNSGKVFVFQTPMAGPAPALSAAGIVNAASGNSGPIAPGEILSLYGSNLGPTPGRGLQLDRPGHVGNILANVQVLFDSTPGTLTYVSSNQINVIAPYDLARKNSVAVVVRNNGVLSAPITMTVAPASPALFTADGSGRGLAAVVNQDGTLNSPSNPASAGSVVSLFGTGEGVLNPGVSDGSVTTASPPVPLTPLSATIAGTNATVLYGGEVTGLVSGVFQVNVQLPTNPGGSAIEIKVASGSAVSPPVTIAVKP